MQTFMFWGILIVRLTVNGLTICQLYLIILYQIYRWLIEFTFCQLYYSILYQICRWLFEFMFCQLYPKELKDKEYDPDEEVEDSDDYEEDSDEADNQ